jgi:hypothetical protein
MCEQFFLLVIFSAKFAIEVNRVAVGTKHGLINNIDIKAKCRHLKKMICKGTLQQVFITVYRLEI